VSSSPLPAVVRRPPSLAGVWRPHRFLPTTPPLRALPPVPAHPTTSGSTQFRAGTASRVCTPLGRALPQAAAAAPGSASPSCRRTALDFDPLGLDPAASASALDSVSSTSEHATLSHPNCVRLRRPSYGPIWISLAPSTQTSPSVAWISPACASIRPDPIWTSGPGPVRVLFQPSSSSSI
jgi:hypothetical protein